MPSLNKNLNKNHGHGIRPPHNIVTIINFYIAGPPRRLIMLTNLGPSKRFITITISGSSRKIIIFTSYRSIKSHGHGPRSPIKMLTIAPNQSKPYCIEGHIISKVILISHHIWGHLLTRKTGRGIMVKIIYKLG